MSKRKPKPRGQKRRKKSFQFHYAKCAGIVFGKSIIRFAVFFAKTLSGSMHIIGGILFVLLQFITGFWTGARDQCRQQPKDLPKHSAPPQNSISENRFGSDKHPSPTPNYSSNKEDTQCRLLEQSSAL